MSKGLYMYCYKGSMFLYKHKGLYGILQFTGGIIYTIIGSIIALFAILFGGQPIRFNRHYMIFIGNAGGGLELGLGGLIANNMSNEWTYHSMCHEAGHCYQNALLGPFAIFLVMIPSAIRYGYQRIRTSKGLSNKPYDSIGFEGSASDIGHILYDK